MSRILVILENADFVEDIIFAANNLLKNGKESLFVGIPLPQLANGSFSLQAEKKAFQQANSNVDDDLISEVELATGVIGVKFEKKLHEAGLKARLCQGECFDPHMLERETRFADLLIISQSNFLHYLVNQESYSELNKWLKGSNCPLFVIPNGIHEIDSIYLIHQNEKLAQTIKSFVSSFPSKVKSKEVSLLGNMPENEEEIMMEKGLVDFLRQHFSNLGVMVFHDGNLSERANDYISTSANPLVVLCGYDKESIKNLLIPNLSVHPEGRNVSFFIGNSC